MPSSKLLIIGYCHPYIKKHLWCGANKKQQIPHHRRPTSIFAINRRNADVFSINCVLNLRRTTTRIVRDRHLTRFWFSWRYCYWNLSVIYRILRFLFVCLFISHLDKTRNHSQYRWIDCLCHCDIGSGFNQTFIGYDSTEDWQRLFWTTFLD